MKCKSLEIPDVKSITPKAYRDNRGHFFESYNKKEFEKIGIFEDFVQDNQSSSRYHALRGLHFQLNPKAQGKLVRVVHGKVFDVAVDIRKGSPTFGKWVSAELSLQNRKMLYIPPGFAHGFQALTNKAIFSYKCTEFYSKEHEASIVFDDPDIGIDWPSNVRDYKYWQLKISEKDYNAPLLKDVMDKINFIYEK